MQTMPNDMILRNADKVKRLSAANIQPENCSPLTEEQIELRALWREFSRVELSDTDLIDRNGNKMQVCNALKTGNSNVTGTISAPSPSLVTAEESQAIQRNAARLHSEKMTMLSSWLRKVEILSTNSTPSRAC
jgi:hypothetical protein